jgi:hypothetical protein
MNAIQCRPIAPVTRSSSVVFSGAAGILKLPSVSSIHIVIIRIECDI